MDQSQDTWKQSTRHLLTRASFSSVHLSYPFTKQQSLRRQREEELEERSSRTQKAIIHLGILPRIGVIEILADLDGPFLVRSQFW